MWKIKILVAPFLLVLMLLIDSILHYLGILLSVPPLMAIGAVLLIFADFIVGVVAAIVRREFKLRRIQKTGGKILFYVVLVGSTSILANSFGGSPYAIATDFLLGGVFLYISSSEWVSIIVTASGSNENASKLIRKIFRLGRILKSDDPREDLSKILTGEDEEQKSE